MPSVEKIVSQHQAFLQSVRADHEAYQALKEDVDGVHHQLAIQLLQELSLPRIPGLSDQLIWQAVDYADEKQVDVKELLRGVVEAALLCHEYDPARDGVPEVAADLEDPTQLREAGLKIFCVQEWNSLVLAKSIAVLENRGFRRALTEQERQELALNYFIFSHVPELRSLQKVRSRQTVELNVNYHYPHGPSGITG